MTSSDRKKLDMSSVFCCVLSPLNVAAFCYNNDDYFVVVIKLGVNV